MTGQVTPDSEATEFDRLMALDEGSAPAQDPPAPAAPAPAAAAEPAQEQGAQGTPAEGGESGGSTPDPAGGAPDAQDDWINALPEDARNRIAAEREAREAERKAAEDRYKALHGKVAPLQRQLSEAQRLIHTPSQTPAPAQAAPVQAPDQTADEFFQSPEWKQWAEDYPGDAKVLRQSLEAQQRRHQQQLSTLESRINTLDQRLNQTHQVVSRNVANDEIRLLEARHPDWKELNAQDSPFWDWFEDFRAAQPPAMQAIYYNDDQLKKLFNDGKWVADTIDAYKATLTPAAGTPAATPTPAAQPDSAQAAPAAAPNPRLAMSVAPSVRGGSAVPPPVNLDSLSEAEQFEHAWANTP